LRRGSHIFAEWQFHHLFRFRRFDLGRVGINISRFNGTPTPVPSVIPVIYICTVYLRAD
jgi:hypothetical protein